MQRKTEKLFRIFKRISMGPHTIDELYRWTKTQDMHLSKRTLYRYLEEIECFLSDGRHEIEVKLNGHGQKEWQVVDREREQMNQAFAGKSHENVISNLIPDAVLNLWMAYENHGPEAPIHDKLVIRSGFRESRADRKREHVLYELTTALQKSRKLNLRFTRLFAEAHELPKEILCGPYSLIFHDGGFFLALRRPENGQTMFAPVECIESAIMTDEPFTNDLQPQELQNKISRSFGLGRGPMRAYEIELMLQSSKEHYSPCTDPDIISQKKWHPQQQITRGTNGDCIIRMKTHITRDLVLWIAGFGDQMVIRSPQKLKTLYKKMLEGMMEKNGD
jgi:hypothetical protein